MFTVLVVAKAPVAGEAKTRIGAAIGAEAAADLAAAALLDTLDTVCRLTSRDRRVVALTGDVAAGARRTHLSAALEDFLVVPQRGGGLAARLANAHADAATLGTPVVQIGMDTPQVRPADLTALVGLLEAPADAALGLAGDGGWWGLALRSPVWADALRAVSMSMPTTGQATLDALRAAGARVGLGHELDDVDTWADAQRVAAGTMRSTDRRFAAAVAHWSADIDARPHTTV